MNSVNLNVMLRLQANDPTNAIFVATDSVRRET